MNPMQEIQPAPEPSAKTELATSGIILLSMLLTGPLAGCYFMGRNFKALGNTNESKRWYRWGIISILALVVANIVCQQVLHIQNYNNVDMIISIWFIVIIMLTFNRSQSKKVIVKMGAGWKKYPWYKVLGISFLCLVITLTFGFVVTVIIHQSLSIIKL